MRFFLLAVLIATATLGCKDTFKSVQAAREPAGAGNAEHNGQESTSGLTQRDTAFIEQAEEDSLKERNLGRVVLDKSTNDEVRKYAQMLVDDHTKALRSVVELMQRLGMPQPKALVDVKHEALAELNKYSGAEFDRRFIQLMISDHEKAVAEFRTEAETTQSQLIREYARDFLPVLEKHLTQAQELEKQIT
jgi:putative membrane protein